MFNAPDVHILDRAVADRRIVVTADLDFARLLAILESHSPGLILFRGGRLSEQEAVIRLQRAMRLLSSDQLEQSIVVIERVRIRRRALPILRREGDDEGAD
jgi:predicted nuclease of predicted toxin-antitoxin system